MSEEPRHEGRRGMDSAHVVKWVPVVSMMFVMLVQTVFVVRYVAGLESQIGRLNEGYSDLKAEVKALAVATAQGAVPSALNDRRIGDLERQLSTLQDMRSKSYENDRRISALEAKLRAGKER